MCRIIIRNVLRYSNGLCSLSNFRGIADQAYAAKSVVRFLMMRTRMARLTLERQEFQGLPSPLTALLLVSLLEPGPILLTV